MKSFLFKSLVFVCLGALISPVNAQFAGSGNLEEEIQKEISGYTESLSSQTISKSSPSGNSNSCCSSGICKVGAKEWSCNLMKNTPIGDHIDMDVTSLLSHIAIGANALEVTGLKNTKYHGTKKFCEACYTKILASHDDFKGKTDKDLKLKMKEVKDELAASGVEQILIQRFYRYIEQKRFYQKYKASIDASLDDLFSKENMVDKSAEEIQAARIEEEKRILCLPQEQLPGSSKDCPEAKKYINKFFKKYDLHDKKNNNDIYQISDDVDIFDPIGNVKINTVLETLGQKYKKVIKHYGKKFEERDTKLFNETYTKMFFERKSHLKELCLSMKNEYHKLNIERIYETMLGSDDKNISAKDLKYRVQGLQQMINSVNMANPDLMTITRDVKTICGKAESEKYTKDYFNFFSGKNDKERPHGLLDNVLLNTDFNKDHTALFQLQEMAKADCLSSQTKIETEKMLCGKISNSELLLRLDMDEGVLGDNLGKLAYAKLQCNENINVINTSARKYNENNYVDQTMPEYTFLMLAQDGGWRKLRNSMRDRLEEIKDSNSTSEYFTTNIGLKKHIERTKENGKRSLKISSRGFLSRMFDADFVVGEDEIEPSIFDSYYDPKTGRVVSSSATSIDSDTRNNNMNFIGPNFDNSGNGGGNQYLSREIEPAHSSEGVQNVFDNFKGESTDILEQPVNAYNSLNSAFTSSELDQFQKENQTQLDEILSDIKGNKTEQKQNLIDYLNEEKTITDIAKSSSNSSELEGEIKKLKQEIAAERVKRAAALDPNSPEGKLDAAHKKIDDLEKMIKNMHNASFSNGQMNPTGSGSFDTREQGKLNQFLQNYDQRAPRQFEFVQGDDGIPRKIASTNILQINSIDEKRFEEVLGKPESYFEYDKKHKELLLKTKDGYEYTINISDVKWDKKTGEVLSFNYKGKQVVYKNLNDNSKVAVNKFLKEKAMAKEINDAIVEEIELNPNLKGPTPEMARYIQMLCGDDGVDPTNPKCEGYLPEVASK